jgi:hypothetical protein
LALTGHIPLVRLGAMPIVPVALHGEPSLAALNHKVNPVACKLYLGNHTVTASMNREKHVDLEPAVERSGDTNLAAVWVGCVSSQLLDIDPADAKDLPLRVKAVL